MDYLNQLVSDIDTPVSRGFAEYMDKNVKMCDSKEEFVARAAEAMNTFMGSAFGHKLGPDAEFAAEDIIGYAHNVLKSLNQDPDPEEDERALERALEGARGFGRERALEYKPQQEPEQESKRESKQESERESKQESEQEFQQKLWKQIQREREFKVNRGTGYKSEPRRA